MASGTATVTVDLKLAFAVPMWLRTALIEQGWTPPADPDREQTIPLARGGIIKPGGFAFVGEAPMELRSWGPDVNGLGTIISVTPVKDES
jgi:hypothetical protein